MKNLSTGSPVPLSGLFALFLALALPMAAGPNILLVSVDGMGYGDASAYGGDRIATVALDRLAAAGVRATAAYAPAPAAAGSRYGLMTGAWPQRFGIQADADANAESPGDRVPQSHLLLPELLRRGGYTTAMVGKWNSRTDPMVWFDHVYSPIDWDADYFPNRDGHYPGVWRETKFDKAGIDYGWGPLREGDEYLTDRLGREAREFIAGQAGSPFFLYLAFNAPGRPLQAKAHHQAAVAHLPTEALQLHAAMLLSIDENVGLLLDQLDQLGIADDTLVIFVSDYGPSFGFDPGWPDHWQREVLGSTGGRRGHKGTFEEGGLRVPFLLRWPAVLGQAQVYAHPVSTLDIYPTVCAAAGVAIPAHMQLDGRDLLPFFTGDASGIPHEELFWMEEQRGALRLFDWKLVVDNNAQSLMRLYDLGGDPAEAVDLAASHAALRDQLLGRWRELAAAMPPSFRELEAYFRQIDIARRNSPQILHVLAEQYRLADFIDELGQALPGIQYLGGGLYYAPSLGFFHTDPASFPLLAHAQWGDIHFYHYPSAPVSYSVLYVLARHWETGQRLGWLIQLSGDWMLFHAPGLDSIVHIPQLDFWELWLFDYERDQWQAYETGLLPPDNDDPDPVEPSLEAYEDFLAAPPDGGAGPALWFKYAREPNHGYAGSWTIGAAAPLTAVREDFYGNPEGAFALEPGSTGGAAISGSGGTAYAAGAAGAVFLTFNSGADVQTLASIFSKGTFSDDDPFEISLYQGSLRLNYRRDAATKATALLLEPVPNTWYTIAVSWDLGRPGDTLAWMIVEMGAGPRHSGTLPALAVGTLDRPIRVAGRNNLNPFFGALQNLAIFERPLDWETLEEMLAAIP